MPSQIIYLHGFASSTRSRKATFFAEKLRAAGRGVLVPDLEIGDFTGITVTKQLKLVQELIGEHPTVLIGSSLGGYVASLAAGQNKAVERVVLLAPAFGFAELWAAALGSKRLSEWKQNGFINVFHYGAGREMPLAWAFLEDAREYPLYPAFQQPAYLFHGERDSVVPLDRSERYVSARKNVRLAVLPSGHELTDVLDRIWQDCKDFVLSPQAEIRC